MMEASETTLLTGETDMKQTFPCTHLHSCAAAHLNETTCTPFCDCVCMAVQSGASVHMPMTVR